MEHRRGIAAELGVVRADPLGVDAAHVDQTSEKSMVQPGTSGRGDHAVDHLACELVAKGHSEPVMDEETRVDTRLDGFFVVTECRDKTPTGAPSLSRATASSTSLASASRRPVRARTVSCTDVRAPGSAVISSLTTNGMPPLRR